MLRIAASTVWSHKRRFAGSLLAVILGVAFLAGTLLLGDTLKANFNKLFAQATGSTDVVLRGSAKLAPGGGRSDRSGVPASLVEQVRGAPGVADAEPYVEGFGQLLGSDGKRIGGNGPPTRAANWISQPSLNPYRLVQGRTPSAGDEVVINRGAAKTGKLHLGDTTTLLTPQPVRVRIVGIATFGSADGFGPSTFTGMTLDAARRDLTGNPSLLTQVRIDAAPGVTPDQLATTLRQQLPGGVQAITGAQLANENLDELESGFLGVLRNGLTGFAIVALLVAVFSIYNTFSILAAQRARESALLRSLGATRRQVIGAGLVEALAVGVAGALAGWAAGIGIAAGLKGVFDGFGFALPAGGLTFTASSAVLSMLAGIVATLIAGALPAVRASRVPPVAALRDQAAEARPASARRGGIGAIFVTGGLAALIATAVRGGPVGLAGVGAVLLLIGMIVLGPLAARPAAAALGAPVAATRGVTGVLARGNAMRNPRRTAATASALLIGVAVVVMFTVVAASLKASASQAVQRSLTAQLVVDTPGYGGSGGVGALDPSIATRLARLPDVAASTGLGRSDALVDGQPKVVTLVDPAAVGDVLDLGVRGGSLADLRGDTLAVSTDVAGSHNWTIGSPVKVTYPDGAAATLRVAAMFSQADISGGYLVPETSWAPHAGQVLDTKVLLALRPGTSVASVKASVVAATQAFGAPRVQDRDEFRTSATSGVNTFLGLIYVMLALAIIIALMGISNTLSLSVQERTRELGVLRALGQSRAQARAMVRWEAVLVAVFGTIGGVMVGTLLGWALVEASSSSVLAVFSAPPAQLLIFLVVGALAGTLAGLRPARRAARLRVLQAISAE